MHLDVARSNLYCTLVANLTTAPGRHAYIFRIRTPRDYGPDALSIDPNREASARPLLQDGWSQTFEGRPGDRYIWATGKHSSLIFQIKHPPKQAILAFSALPFIGPGLPAQKLEIEINGRSLAAVTLLNHEKQYQIPVDGNYLVPGVNRVVFRYTYCAAPRQLNTGPDERQLAVLFKRISLLPVTE